MLKLLNRFSGLAIGSTVVFAGISTVLPVIAVAPIAPQISQAVLGGKPVYVLNMTRSGDRVLVRCYPGQQPRLTIQTRADGIKEGLMVCGS